MTPPDPERPAAAWATGLPVVSESVSTGRNVEPIEEAMTWKTSSWPAFASKRNVSTSPGRSIVPSSVAGSAVGRSPS